MKNLSIKHFQFAILAPLLTILALPALAQEDNPARHAKSLGVAVLLGDELELFRIGTTAFSNKRKTLPAPQDVFSDAVYSAIETEIALEEKYSVTRIKIEQSELKRSREALTGAIGGFMRPVFRDRPPELQNLAERCKCDLMLIALGETAPAFANSNQYIGPVTWMGVVSFGDKPNRTAVYVAVRYLLVDPRTLSIIASAATEADGTRDPYIPHHVAIERWPLEMEAVEDSLWPLLVAASRGFTYGTVQVPLYRLGLRPSCVERHSNYKRRAYGRARDMEDHTKPMFAPGASPEKCR
jgi:hypothetical protein